MAAPLVGPAVLEGASAEVATDIVGYRRAVHGEDRRQGRAESRAPVSGERTGGLFGRALVKSGRQFPSGTCRLMAMMSQRADFHKSSTYRFGSVLIRESAASFLEQPASLTTKATGTAP